MELNFAVCILSYVLHLEYNTLSFWLHMYIGPESAPITDRRFWNFNIWDPGLSSTTTTTTTPPMTGTVTTRGLSTTILSIH